MYLSSRMVKCSFIDTSQNEWKTTSHLLLSVNGGKLTTNILTNELKPMLTLTHLFYHLCIEKNDTFLGKEMSTKINYILSTKPLKK